MFNRSLHDAFHDGVKTAKAALLRVLGRDSCARCRWVERAFLAWLRSAIAGPADARPVKPPRPGLAARAKAAAEAATAA